MEERDEMDCYCMVRGLELIARYDARISTPVNATQLLFKIGREVEEASASVTMQCPSSPLSCSIIL